MYYPEIKQKAIQLRKEGYSYNYIVEHVPVSKSTLSEWLRDVPFVPNKHTVNTIGNARIASGVFRHQIKMDSLEKARIQSEKDIQDLSERDIMMLGLGIYIGEGGKTIHLTKISNADLKIIKFGIRWLKTTFGIKNKNLKIRLHLYPDNDIKECVAYWSKNTGIPAGQFYPSIIDRRINKLKKRKGKLPFGTAHLIVNSLGEKKFGVYLHRLIMAWINRVLC